MAHIDVKSYVLGMIGTNVYIVINTETKEAIIIDPADKAAFLASEIRKGGLKPVAILLTHGHYDHIAAVDSLRDEFGIKVYAHEDEKMILENKDWNTSTMYGRNFELTVKADIFLHDGQELVLAGIHILVLHTPGHTAGGCSYYMPDAKAVFSGDTLFNSSVGRTDFPTGSMSQLVRSVREKLFTLPDDTIVYPGHMSATTIGNEKKYNPFF